MRRPKRPVASRLRLVIVASILALFATPAHATKIVMKDGRVIEGRYAKVSSVGESPLALTSDGAPIAQLIVLCDDQLRRYFVPTRQVASVTDEVSQSLERFVIPQRVATAGRKVTAVGPLLRMTPFDQYGRRTVEMQTDRGVAPVVQGITEITPEWTKVEAIRLEGSSIVWDLRIATTSIPHETLKEILSSQVDSTNLNHRLKLVRFLLQLERYKEAEEELRSVIEDFPERSEQYEPVLRDLRQAWARRILNELSLRRGAGQHDIVYGMLGEFPSEGVAGETLQAVRGMISEYDALAARRANVIVQLDKFIDMLSDTKLRESARIVRDEIAAEMNLNTLSRMVAFEQFIDDANLEPSEKVALAISGWLIGKDDAIRNLHVALSLYDTRNLVRDYMRESKPLERDRILEELRAQEGATPAWVARLLALMAPPLDPGTPVEGRPLMFELSAHSLEGRPPITYYVKVPPQYDPLRLYPAIVTLHAAGAPAEQQIDWWENQAARHGYIVIAPAWTDPHQNRYGYSAEEHAAVLNSLRDACRRFAIDTHRIFLSGHSIGGDAAWDIGIAHPDLWAGVIPIAARSDRYVMHYWENVQHVPMYLVGGELDGDKMASNARDLDRYFKHGYDVTVVEYLGRGHEHFSDEIQKIFDWMGRRKRDFTPETFVCRGMRPWDNYFWWVELNSKTLPPRTIVLPAVWPPKGRFLPAMTKGIVQRGNTLRITSGAGEATIWLSPELVNFSQPITIVYNNVELRGQPFIDPDLYVMLEDARTRADRQHPFWAKVEMPGGRVNAK